MGRRDARWQTFRCAFVRNTVRSVLAARRELPSDTPADYDAPLLVVTLDQGPIGMAGMSFVCYHMGLMVCPRWDDFHRGINDKLLSSCRG